MDAAQPDEWSEETASKAGQALEERLLQAARGAAERAYSPYSNFRVGAAVLAGGRIFTGCNIENASYGLTVCAERVAIFNAVSEGHRRVEALAVCCLDAPVDAPDSSRMPCGACRQVAAEVMPGNAPVFVDGVGSFPLSALLPQAFTLGEG